MYWANAESASKSHLASADVHRTGSGNDNSLASRMSSCLADVTALICHRLARLRDIKCHGLADIDEGRAILVLFTELRAVTQCSKQFYSPSRQQWIRDKYR